MKNRYINVVDLLEATRKQLMTIEDAVDRTPSADVKEITRGHWDLEDDQTSYNCSHCGKLMIGMSYDRIKTFEYCPYCGAEMR